MVNRVAGDISHDNVRQEAYVRTLHAILAIRQRLYRDLVGSTLCEEYDVRIYEESESEIAVAGALRRVLNQDLFSVDDPVIVVTSVDDTNEIPASFSRLLTEFPEVTIVGVSTLSIRSFQVRIRKRTFRCSQKGLLKAIRTCTGDTSP